MDVFVKAGIGDTVLRLPREVGAHVSAQTGIGELTNTGLVRDGNDYVNEAFGEAAHTLYVNISSGTGGIELLGR